VNINFKDIGERVVSTFVLTFAGLIMVAGPTLSLSASQVALMGAVAAVLSLVKNIITELAGASNGATWWQDMLLRVMGTYVQAWIALVVVVAADGSSTIDLSQFKPAALAAIPAALGVLKGYLASKFGDPDTAGFLTNVMSGRNDKVVLGEVVRGDHEAPPADPEPAPPVG
jgi:hypothetical protein